MRFLKRPFIPLLVLALIVGLAGSASANLIAHVDAVAVGPSPWIYSYEVFNDGCPGDENIWVFTVYPADVEVFDIVAPPGWTWYFTDYCTFVKWPSDDPGYDIIPGSSLAGFGFKSLGEPGIVKYDVEGSDPNSWPPGMPTGTVYESTTLGPVPEPTTMVLLGVGIAGLAGYFRRKRGQK